MKLSEIDTLISQKNKDELGEIIKVLLKAHATPVFSLAPNLQLGNADRNGNK
ncbi:hypothetical protein [Wolinella succinogenes]|uniref:hypothetical protein n=1 Tax=Wolinella succinogenes TaxID=844 RepID=UPI00240984C1|nr:hypothetical protein [Wolinella succinogenes]